MKIGNVTIKNNIFLAPMAGVTNLAYRKMCVKYGAGMVTTEMISDKGIFYNDIKTKELAKIDENEHPIAIQIFGSDIDTMLNAAKYVDKMTNADFIDINMGCPVPKVIKSKAGSYYLKDPELAYNVVKTIVENVSKPVTVKMRIGWDHSSINVFEMVESVVKAGASAITIHGRTKSDLYSGQVNYELIKQIKEKYPNVPIIANGDIDSPLKAKEVLEYTKADAIMIGRASYGNPYIFSQINAFLKDGTILPNLDSKEKIEILKDYVDDLVELKGELKAIRELRGQAGWFVKGFPNSAKIREMFSHMQTYQDFLEIIKKI